jgi:hypothetical protein
VTKNRGEKSCKPATKADNDTDRLQKTRLKAGLATGQTVFQQPVRCFQLAAEIHEGPRRRCERSEAIQLVCRRLAADTGAHVEEDGLLRR